MRDKILIFIIGILLGILAGGGFFILKLDDYFRELSFYKKNVRQMEQQMAELSKEDAAREPAADTSGRMAPKKEDSIVTARRPSKEAAAPVAEPVPDATDSVLSVDSFGRIVTDDIIVKKDELLSIRPLELINLNSDPAEEVLDATDSLLQKLSGVRIDRGPSKVLTVELWQSPVNYRGYKMSRNKVVLFGVYPLNGIRLYKLDDLIYLKHQQNLYRLDFTNEFKQFEKVSDPHILAKITS